MHEIREVRVTARKSVTAPFTAPDMAPVATLARELEKGLTGWTDRDVKVPSFDTDHRPTGLAERQLDEITAGKVIRKQRPTAQRVFTAGPSAEQRAARAALEARLAARKRRNR